jgi:small GTP-binding protein
MLKYDINNAIMVMQMNKPCKVTVVGMQGVGKSSLSDSMRNSEPGRNGFATVGANFQMIKDDSGETVINLWDTSGHPLHKNIVKRFCDADIIVACINLTSPLSTQRDYVCELIQAAREHRKDVKVVVVGTKNDLSNEREISSEELTAFSAELHASQVHEVSAKSKHDVGKLKAELVKLVKNSELIDSLFKDINEKIQKLIRKYEHKNDENADKIKHAALKLSEQLLNSKDRYLASEIDLDTLKQECKAAIEVARPVFKDHRGWHKINVVLRGFLGALATLTVLPALIVACGTKTGYVGTFFSTPKTASEKELDDLEAKLKAQK